MTERIAEYELFERLEVDTPGVVHDLARRSGDPDATVVVRRLLHHATDEAFERFSTELRALHAVMSDHVVPVTDAGVEDGLLYTVSPWYPAGTLADGPGHGTAPGGGDRLRQDLALVADAADGVHALHEGGVLHRNIRPPAVFRNGDVGMAGDLGLIQLLWPGLTSTGFGPLGAMAYGDPAVLLGRAAGRSSDIWSLGATAHWAATGAVVFPDLDTMAVSDAVRAVAGGTPQIVTTEGTAVDGVIRRALAPDPADRHQTAAAFADDLRHALEGA